MTALAHILEATVRGLFTAMLAPAFAVATLCVALACRALIASETFETSFRGLLPSLLGMTTAAYMLIALPAFFAGIALPSLQRRLSPRLAVFATGLIGAALFVLLSRINYRAQEIELTLAYGIPVMLGMLSAASVVVRINSSSAEA